MKMHISESCYIVGLFNKFVLIQHSAFKI